jgi:polyhydroxyalkanoate synthesis repressor PhaR
VETKSESHETQAEPERPRRIIKRYSNRKLYDTKDSRYVTLLQIAEMVRTGEEVQIIDNNTKDDLTEVTLAQIIYEEQKNTKNVPLQTLRELIHQRTENVLTQLREGPIGRLIPGIPFPTGDEEQKKDRESAESVDPPKPTLVEHAKERFEDWQHHIDERIKTLVPNLLAWQSLQHEVKRLSQRIEELEAMLKNAEKKE